MPVTRFAIREGKTPEYKRALMDEIYEAMRETANNWSFGNGETQFFQPGRQPASA